MNNLPYYGEFLELDEYSVRIQLDQYIRGDYGTSVGDVVIIALANILDVTIFILTAKDDTYVLEFPTRDCIYPNRRRVVSTNDIYLLKRGEHYDALIAPSSLSDGTTSLQDAPRSLDKTNDYNAISFPTTMDFIPSDDEFLDVPKRPAKRKLSFQKDRRHSSKFCIPSDYWDNVPIIEDKKIPFDINDKCAYRVPFDEHKGRFRAVKDGRPWANARESKRSGFEGDRYLATCMGSFQCLDEDCAHFSLFGKVNRRQFTPKGVCSTCQSTNNERMACPARKVFEFEADAVTVKHYGKHTCSPIKPKEAPYEYKNGSSGQKASVIMKTVMGDMIRSGKSMKEIEEASDKLIDKGRMNKAKYLSNKSSVFGKIDDLRQRFKGDDKFYIYQLQFRGHSGNPTYVFKTSKATLQMCKDMDVEGEHPLLSKADAYLDGNEKRVKMHTALTLSTYHSVLKRQVVLARMDCEGESQESARLFWNLLNKALGDLFEDEDYKFNPHGLILDERGCNWIATEEVFGVEFMKR